MATNPDGPHMLTVEQNQNGSRCWAECVCGWLGPVERDMHTVVEVDFVDHLRVIEASAPARAALRDVMARLHERDGHAACVVLTVVGELQDPYRIAPSTWEELLVRLTLHSDHINQATLVDAFGAIPEAAVLYQTKPGGLAELVRRAIEWRSTPR